MVTDGLNPFTVMVFAGAVLAGFALAATYVFARLTKREPLARVSSRLLIGGAGVYLVLLVVGAITSRSRVLAPGEEKHICEIDCHLAYSVAAATSESLPGGLVRHVVTVKVRFDEATISSRRSRTAKLSPNRRYVALVDSQGHRYRGSTEGLMRELIPDQSYTTDIAFEVPRKSTGLRLILRNADPQTSFLIGHENGPFHAKTTFALPS